MRSFTLSILIILSLVKLSPAANAAFVFKPGKLPADSSAVRLRVPSGNSINSFRLDKDFIYDDRLPSPGLSEIINSWIMEKLRWLLGTGTVSFIFKYINYIIIAAAVVLVAFIIRKLRVTGLLYTREQMEPEHISYDGENIRGIDPDKLIAEAIEKNEFRTAIRYCYIKSLKLLGDSSLVELKSNKTNTQYIKELKEPELRKLFGQLTLVFEWIWYGEAPVEHAFFEEAKNHFDTFNRLITAKR